MGVCGRRTRVRLNPDVSDEIEMADQEGHDGLEELGEDARALQKRDRAFLFRLGLRLTVAILFGIWVALSLGEADVGGCAAQGFQTVSE